MPRLPDYELLTATNPKIIKGQKEGVKQYCSVVMHLAPGTLSGKNLCPFASPGCLQACLNTSGRGKFSAIKNARRRRSQMFLKDRRKFFETLINEISHFVEFCGHHTFTHVVHGKAHFKSGGKMFPAVRLNGTSDIPFERLTVPGTGNTIFELFPRVQFYDYTKIPKRFERPRNYHLTYSRHELPESEEIGMDYMDQGVNMAVVFDTPKNHSLPPVYQSHYFNHPVVDGSGGDQRFLDPKGYIVGLYALGAAKDDTSGFVVHAALRNPQRRLSIDREAEEKDSLFPDLE